MFGDNPGVLETASATKFIEEILVKALGDVMKKISQNDVAKQKRDLQYFWQEAGHYPTDKCVTEIFAKKHRKLWKALGG